MFYKRQTKRVFPRANSDIIIYNNIYINWYVWKKWNWDLIFYSLNIQSYWTEINMRINTHFSISILKCVEICCTIIYYKTGLAPSTPNPDLLCSQIVGKVGERTQTRSSSTVWEQWNTVLTQLKDAFSICVRMCVIFFKEGGGAVFDC